MRVLGIDPGYAIVGWGVVEAKGGRLTPLGYGAITTKAGTPMEQRLAEIAADMQSLLAQTKPDCLAIEKLFFNTNTTTAIDVAQARGVILAACAKAGLSVHEYTPSQVKQGVVGYGKAEKFQVMEMTRQILRLKSLPKPDDTADALAIAICHANTATSQLF